MQQILPYDEIVEGINSLNSRLQLPPVREKLVFSKISDDDSMKHLIGLKLQHLFKYAELIEVMQQNDQLFIDLPNKVRDGNCQS